MNILFLTEIAPFPVNGGEKLRSYGLLKIMSDLNFTVHAIIGKSSVRKAKVKDFDGVTFYEYDFGSRICTGRLTKYFHLFSRDEKLILLLDQILKHNAIDIAYIDYHLYGQYIGYFREKSIPVIYGTHNAQAKLIYQRPAVSFKNSITRFIDYLLNRAHEFYFFRQANALIVVSENDKKYHQAFIKKEKIFVIPNFLIESEYIIPAVKKENYILMTANFGAFQNSFGLEWFIREIWDQEIRSKTRLYLVGLNSHIVYANLKAKYDVTNVLSIGEVEDLKPYIANATASIVPLLHGSGSRLKCIESMALKTQLISTSKGAEGIEHHHSILLADNPGDFKIKLLAILKGEVDLTEAAYKAFLDTYSRVPNKAIFNTIIHFVTAKN